MQLPVKNMAGQQVGAVELNDTVFAAPINGPLMHQALVRQLANARQGTHSTKERGEVAGGGKKPWRQKGTGRARQGSTRAPNFIGGGVVFGPKPRKYTQSLPKKMARAALRSALSVKAESGQLVVVDAVATDQFKTKVMVGMLNALGLKDQRVLMVLNEKNEQVWRSSTNLPTLKTLLSGYVNVRDLLGHDVVLFSSDAIKEVEQWLATGLSDVEADVSDAEIVGNSIEVDDAVADGSVTTTSDDSSESAQADA